MVKTPVKKTVQKAKPKYTLTVKMNDEVFKCATNDLEEALGALKPISIKTRVIIRIDSAIGAVERILMVRSARLLFRNPLTRHLFVKGALAATK